MAISLYYAIQTRKKLKILLDETLHELNIPLATILANAQLLSYGAKDDKSLSRINRITSAAKNLQKSLSVLESNMRNELVAPKRELFEASQVIKHIIADISLIYKERKINCNIESFWLETDEYEFIQAVRNIIHNALKFSPNQSEVEITFQNNQLLFIDQGCGMDASLIVSIFERYYQSEQNNNGKGIGLFIVKRYCDKNNVKIFLKPNLPQGSVVTLDLTNIISKTINNK